MLDGMMEEGLTDLSKDLQKRRVPSHTATRGKRIPDRANSDVPEAGTYLGYLGKSKAVGFGTTVVIQTRWQGTSMRMLVLEMLRRELFWVGKAIESIRKGWKEAAAAAASLGDRKSVV